MTTDTSPGDQIHAAHADYPSGEPSTIGTLVSDIAGDLSTLLRQEIELAKAEARESASTAGSAAGMLGAAGMAAHLALLFLSIAVWWGLGAAIDNLGWSAVIVAAVWGVIAASMAAVGRRRLKNVTGLTRTAETAKRIPAALKGEES